MGLRLEPSLALLSHPLHPQPSKQKRKFSSFFKSLVIELDKELYGPDNHLVEVSGGLGLGSTGWCARRAEKWPQSPCRAGCVCSHPPLW